MADAPKSLITPEVTLSYPHLFEPVLRKDAKPGDKLKFSTTSLFTHEAVATPEFAAIKQAVQECAIAAYGLDVFKDMIAEGTFVSPFHKDIKTKGYDPVVFAVRINSTSGEGYPPAVVSRSGKPITDKREIYPGVKARVSLSCRAYGGPGTKYKPGVMLDLRNVQKLGDGERLAGGAGTGDEFEKLPEESPAPISDQLKNLLD